MTTAIDIYWGATSTINAWYIKRARAKVDPTERIQRDRLLVGLFSWMFFRGVGWMMPWSANEGRSAYDAMSQWASFLSQHPNQALAVWTSVVAFVGLVCWIWRLWRLQMLVCVYMLAMSAFLAVGFFVTNTDPPALAYAANVLLFFYETLACADRYWARRAQLATTNGDTDGNNSD